jgi:hypothetical protein
VKAACLDYHYGADWFDEARRWKILSVKEVQDHSSRKLKHSENYKTFAVTFRHYQRYTTDPTDFTGACLAPWTFTLERQPGGRWVVINYGMC